MKSIFLLISINVLSLFTLQAQDNISKDLLLINSLKNYEMNAHSSFQKELYLSSDKYISGQGEKFVDNETGFFKLWSEAFRFFQSDTKKNARWKNRLEKYFRATEYSTYINQEQQRYSETINQQRQELLGKLHHSKKQLNLKSKGVDAVNISDDKINEVVVKVNSLVLVEVIPEVVESFLVPLFISLIGMFFGVFLGGKTKSIIFVKIIIFVIALFFSIWQSSKYSNELERQINNSFSLKENKHLTILDELQKNTIEYYSELTIKIQQ